MMLPACKQHTTHPVLVHVQEYEYGAAPFNSFFAQCPPRLKDAGLFDELACAWFFTHPYVDVACKVVGLKLQGAVLTEKKGKSKETRSVVHPLENDTAKKMESKPSARQESKPSARQESKPSARQESKPSARQESKPSARQESKPSARQESKPSTRQPTQGSLKQDVTVIEDIHDDDL
jgi:hypothetical protein